MKSRFSLKITFYLTYFKPFGTFFGKFLLFFQQTGQKSPTFSAVCANKGSMQADLTLQIIRTAREKFGISAPKPYQLLVMQRILEQENGYSVRHQIVVLPTGTGKSLCFLLPATLCKGLTIIVYPLLALMNDQVSKLKKAGIPCICIHGGQTREERRSMFQSLGKTTKIVITTAESLQNPSVLYELRKHKVSLFVVDEAHVISQWGKDFRPAYMKLGSIVSTLEPKQILAFTATASNTILNDIKRTLFPTKPLVVNADADRPNIIYSSYPTLNRMQGVLDLVQSVQKPALVFCRTRRDAQNVAIFCKMETPDLDIRYYHAGLSNEERKALENWFMESTDGVLCATSAYGMGLDKASVRSVIHHRLPQSIEEYLQESGRAGRDGRISNAYVVVTYDDLVTKKPYSPILSIFTNHECRRRALLSQLGQQKDECSGCDVCFDTVIKEMKTDYALRTLVRKWPFRFEPMTAAYTLCNTRNKKALGLENAMNPLLGVGENWNTKNLVRTIEHLASDKSPYPISSIRVFGLPQLLYPSENILYNGLAHILRGVDYGYRWIVRKKGQRPKSSTKAGES